jgi:hypothetical protein
MFTISCASDDLEKQAPCPLVATQCAQGCTEIKGRRAQNGCLEEFSVIGCQPAPGGGTLDDGCIKSTADGQFFQLSSGSDEGVLGADAAWELCTPQEEQSILQTPDCIP